LGTAHDYRYLKPRRPRANPEGPLFKRLAAPSAGVRRRNRSVAELKLAAASEPALLDAMESTQPDRAPQRGFGDEGAVCAGRWNVGDCCKGRKLRFLFYKSSAGTR